jgi:hypothetical protein
MLKFLLLFTQLNIILRNLPLFFVLGCVVSLVFPILYPHTSGAELSELAGDCVRESLPKTLSRNQIEKCINKKQGKDYATQVPK